MLSNQKTSYAQKKNKEKKNAGKLVITLGRVELKSSARH
jgi:hypothetical protein